MPNNVAMTTSEAIEHYGSRQALAAALDLKLPSIYDWGDHPPDLRQIQLEMLTAGQLRAEASCYGMARGGAKA